MDHATTNVPLEAAHAAKKALVTHEWITPRNAAQAHAGPHGHTDHTTDGASGPKLLFPNLISIGGDGARGWNIEVIEHATSCRAA